MATLSKNIARTITALDNIKIAIEEKSGIDLTGFPVEDYSVAIDNIASGGGIGDVRTFARQLTALEMSERFLLRANGEFYPTASFPELAAIMPRGNLGKKGSMPPSGSVVINGKAYFISGTFIRTFDLTTFLYEEDVDIGRPPVNSWVMGGTYNTDVIVTQSYSTSITIFGKFDTLTKTFTTVSAPSGYWHTPVLQVGDELYFTPASSNPSSVAIYNMVTETASIVAVTTPSWSGWGRPFVIPNSGFVHYMNTGTTNQTTLPTTIGRVNIATKASSRQTITAGYWSKLATVVDGIAYFWSSTTSSNRYTNMIERFNGTTGTRVSVSELTGLTGSGESIEYLGKHGRKLYFRGYTANTYTNVIEYDIDTNIGSCFGLSPLLPSILLSDSYVKFRVTAIYKNEMYIVDPVGQVIYRLNLLDGTYEEDSLAFLGIGGTLSVGGFYTLGTIVIMAISTASVVYMQGFSLPNIPDTYSYIIFKEAT